MLNWRGRYLIVDYSLSFNAIPKKSEGRGGEKKIKKNCPIWWETKSPSKRDIPLCIPALSHSHDCSITSKICNISYFFG